MKKALLVLVPCFLFIASISVYNRVYTDTLRVIEVTENNYFTPKEEISISKIQKLIANYLKQRGTKGDISSSMELTEITVKEIWKNTGTRMFRIDLDYAWLHGVAVIKGEKVLCVLGGMPTYGVFLADLDNDGIYEVYTNAYFGSGIVSSEIRGYNIASDKKYSLSMRGEKDLVLFIEDNTLLVKQYDYLLMHTNSEPILTGRLAIKDTKGKKELYIEEKIQYEQ